MFAKSLVSIGLALVVAGTALAFWYHFSPPSPFVTPQVQEVDITKLPQDFTSEKLRYQPPPLDITGPSLDIGAAAGVVLDLTTGKVFWSRDPYSPYFIASLSKLMTASVALELAQPNLSITVSPEAAQTGEASMNLEQGEIYTLEELLWGLLLHSANDAAVAIAEGTAGRSLAFTQLMNYKADQLHLVATHFVNPSGLDEDLAQGGSFLPGQSFHRLTGSTASVHDLVVLTKYALDNHPLITQILESPSHVLSASSHHPQKPLYNIMGLAHTHPAIIAGKTGTSDLAGLSVIELAQKNQHLLLIILLASPSPRQEVVDLLNYALPRL